MAVSGLAGRESTDRMDLAMQGVSYVKPLMPASPESGTEDWAMKTK
jgi:hypothetical protein